MPISFPATVRGNPSVWAKNLIQKPFDYVPAPNMGGPNYRFNSQTLGSGQAKILPQGHQQNPGVNPALTYVIYNRETRPQHMIDARLYREDEGTLNMTLSGVSRDSAGSALGTCRVMIFRTEDMSFVTETTSDASGVWSINLMKGGPFFIVEYKAGAPDRAGTSVNTLTPV